MGFAQGFEIDDFSAKGIHAVRYSSEYQILTTGNSPVVWPGKLTTVIFGLRTPLEHRNLIRSINNDPTVQYQSATLHPSKYKLLLKADCF